MYAVLSFPCLSHVGMNFENACCVLLVSHLPSKALLEVFFPLQGISLSDSNVMFAIHICAKLVILVSFSQKNV